MILGDCDENKREQIKTEDNVDKAEERMFGKVLVSGRNLASETTDRLPDEHDVSHVPLAIKTEAFGRSQSAGHEFTVPRRSLQSNHTGIQGHGPPRMELDQFYNIQIY